MSNITKEEAKEAVKVLLRFIGEDPTREGLYKTPDRVINSYLEIFSGYSMDISKILETKFDNIYNFNDFVLLRNIRFNSFCEHHLQLISGHAHIAYIPGKYLIGISKIARILHVFAKRLQVQERLTVQTATTLQKFLDPLGVAIKITASHGCMSSRGVLQDSKMDTIHYTGIFQSKEELKLRFLSLIKKM